MSRIVVTGATGFIGRELVPRLAAHGGYEVLAASRQAVVWNSQAVSSVILPDLSETVEPAALDDLLAEADTVVHLAAITPASTTAHPAEMLSANVGGLEAIVKASIRQGVKTFVYLSTSLVAGSRSASHPITETSPAAPSTTYAMSKLLAERALIHLASTSSMNWTIIRPPLVYGPGVRGSLRTLTRAAISPIPMPFGAVTSNRRDMIAVRNLSSFVMHCLIDPRASRQCFVVRDGQSISTQALIEAIATATGRRAFQVPVPHAVLAAGGRFSSSIARLIDDYRIDDSKARSLLNWQPPCDLPFDLQRMVRSIITDADTVPTP